MAQAGVVPNRVVALGAIFLPDLRMVLLCHLAADLSERNSRTAARAKRVPALAGKCAEGTPHTRDGANGIGRGARRDSFVFWRPWGDCLRSGDATARSSDWKCGKDTANDGAAGFHGRSSVIHLILFDT